MRRFFATTSGLLALFLLGEGEAVRAQEWCAPPPAAAAPVPCWQPGAYPNEPLFGLQLMLGQETGVRGQVTVASWAQESFVVEGFAGALFQSLGSSPALGVGARYEFWAPAPIEGGAFGVGPGLSVFFQTNHDGLILLAPSVDLGYKQRLCNGLDWEVGLDIGLGIGVGGHTKHGHSAVGDLTPLISVYTGLRF
jgi:hypothetical protein